MNDESLFAAALEKPSSAERSAFLDEACAGDAALRQRVEALLHALEMAGDYLERPAVEQMADAAPATDATAVFGTAGRPAPAYPPPEEDGDDQEAALAFLQPSSKPGSLGRLGHYEVLQVLGHGGFGIVLKAFDEMLHRVVAIKVMAPHLAATSPARKRFLREARVVGGHPPRERRRHLQRRGTTGPLPGDGVHRRRDLAAAAGPARSAGRAGGAAHRPADRRGAGGGARAGADPPRHQAGQYPAGKRHRAGSRSPTSGWPARPTTPA